MRIFDVVVLGAGAAGLMCALRAGQRGRKVLVLERGSEIGAKILISGGGRCNFTNRTIAADRYLSENPRFCLSALKSYTQKDFVTLVEKHRIAYHEKTLGQLFCDGSARSIVAMLLEECVQASVVVETNCEISSVSKPDAFEITYGKEVIRATSLVVATGGLSIPKLGASAFAYDVARQFGLAITETRPALVPLTFSGAMLERMRALAGVSLDIVTSSGKTRFHEAMVFTHRGLSGPAILQISSYWRSGSEILIDLLPETDAEAFLLSRKKGRAKAELKTVLGEVLPQRLAQDLAGHTQGPIGDIPHKELRDMALDLKRWRLLPTGDEGYAKAEVTAGGISTHDLSSKTMQANKIPGLYFIGEAVDVTGWLGGYNFQWAWSSGWAAGSAV